MAICSAFQWCFPKIFRRKSIQSKLPIKILPCCFWSCLMTRSFPNLISWLIWNYQKIFPTETVLFRVCVCTGHVAGFDFWINARIADFLNGGVNTICPNSFFSLQKSDLFIFSRIWLREQATLLVIRNKKCFSFADSVITPIKQTLNTR